MNRILAATILFAACLQGQVITTVAGTNWFFPPYTQPALNAPLGGVSGSTTDVQGNLYIADPDNNIVFTVTPQGVLSILAGNGLAGFSGDGGPATIASLNSPTSVAVDVQGDVYIADYGNYRVRLVRPDGTISTFAGNGSNISYGDNGPAINAGVTPYGIALGPSGQLYIADTYASKVRLVNASGTIVNVAGNGQPAISNDGGPATNSGVFPVAVAVDANGYLYIADYYNNMIRRVSPDGNIIRVAGNGTAGFTGDRGLAVSAELNGPMGVAVDSAGNFYIADTGNNRVRMVSAAAGTINTVAGNGFAGFGGDGGPATAAEMFPAGVWADSSGNLFIADAGNHRMRMVTPNGNVQTVAGNGAFQFAGDGGPAVSAALSGPQGIAIDSTGNLYIADEGNHRVRMVAPGGAITTIAGNGALGFSGDGAATGVGVDPVAIALDSRGNLYIADNFNNRVRMVSPTGIITTVAGVGQAGFGGDNQPATSALLNGPTGLAFDAAGNLYIADQGNSRIRMVTPAGVISTVAGNGKAGFSGDNGPAVNASLYYASGVFVDSSGDLFICDEYNGRIREVAARTGIITTIAGKGGAGFSGDGGPAINALLNMPYSIALDRTGNLYIADAQNNRIRFVTPNSVIGTIAGSAVEGYAGDGGLATTAALNTPSAVSLDANGNLFIADYANDRIREVVSVSAVTINVSQTSLNFTATSGGSLPPPQSVNITTSITGVAFTATTSAPWISALPANGTAPVSILISVDPTNLPPGPQVGSVTISAPGAVPSTTVIAISFNVQPALPPQPAVSSTSISLTAVQNSTPVSGQFQVLNQGGGTLAFTAAASTTSGGSWLTVTPTGASATPSTPATMTVTADPGLLVSGTYQGIVQIQGQQGNVVVNVTLSVTASNPMILTSQSGLNFSVVAQGGAPLPQTFRILNTGVGPMAWSATAATLSGGTWLQISPAGGTVTQPYLDSFPVTVSINPAGLAAGEYYGRILVTAPASNSPQVLTVMLNVLAGGSTPGPDVEPTGLIFTGVAGQSPGSQDITIANPKPVSDTFRSTAIGGGFAYLPTNASVAPNQPMILRVFPDFTHLQPGVYQGSITLQFSDGTPRTINVVNVVAPAGNSGQLEEAHVANANQLTVVWQTPGPNFTAVLGKALPIAVKVVDSAGRAVSGANASVNLVFFNGDKSQPMTYSGSGGVWTYTWTPSNSTPAQGVVNATATNSTGSVLQGGYANQPGSLSPPTHTPAFTAGGVQQAASLVLGAPIAPGMLITLKGSNLADSASQTPGAPLPTQWNGAQVLLGNEPLPLLYTADGQINAQVPYDVPFNTPFQLTVQRDAALSSPAQLVIAAAQPGVFTVDASGNGEGFIFRSDGATLAQPASCNIQGYNCSPATAGEMITILCTGLGAVTPSVSAGVLPPGSPPSTVTNPVSVTIGGLDGQASGAILIPGSPGVYQVTATVPAGVSGDTLPVVVTVAGQPSVAVTMSVQ